MAEGVVLAGRFGGGGRALYTLLLLTAGGCVCAQVSRDAPQPLPGDYTVGDKVFYKGANYRFPSGDNKLMYGQQGEVVGPATAESYKGKGVSVRFPGNEVDVQCLLTTVRHLRAASAATTPARASTHATLATPRASPRQPLPRGPSPHCMRSRRRPHCPGAGGMVAEGMVWGGCSGGSAREGGSRAPPSYFVRPVAACVRS